jgi:hypothetical protein
MANDIPEQIDPDPEAGEYNKTLLNGGKKRHVVSFEDTCNPKRNIRQWQCVRGENQGKVLLIVCNESQQPMSKDEVWYCRENQKNTFNKHESGFRIVKVKLIKKLFDAEFLVRFVQNTAYPESANLHWLATHKDEYLTIEAFADREGTHRPSIGHEVWWVKFKFAIRFENEGATVRIIVQLLREGTEENV